MTSPIQKLHSLGQSLWFDNIQRRMLENGELATLIERGEIRGMTSNPTIFLHAIAKSSDYDSALLPMAWSGWESESIFWELAIEDIREACDLFASLYQQSRGADGYVSLEVSPMLSHNTEGTLGQAKQLWEWVNRRNLMIKIPATREGLPGIRAAIAAGINVNITLIFSIERYRAVMDAYLGGLDDRLVAGLPVRGIASVASFFVSRMDVKVDPLLPEGSPLRGKTAIAYTKLAYDEFRKVFKGERFAKYRLAGCRLQRPLWASTGTKNPAYPDTLYVDNLIGPDTVNTVPPQTLVAFRDHGKADVTILADQDGARRTLSELEGLGISMDKVTRELEEEGVKTFGDAFTSVLQTIDERRVAAVHSLGPLADPVKRRVASLVADNALTRLWSHDPSLWTSDPAGQEEVRIRMGWLDLPNSSRPALKEIHDFATRVLADGLTHVLLLGMGGSSLAPEVLSLIFKDHQMKFSILDSTDPAQVMKAAQDFPPEKTLYLVASKSGGTAEINAMLAYFWEQAGHDGSHFCAITDPGTTLEALANARGFLKTFHADPSVGGRYSALTHFGLVPAALMGIDPEHLLDRAVWMMRQCTAQLSGARNPGLVLGAILGQAALSGRDKLTFMADGSVAPLGAWLEQLIAESSGKQGRGILPVDGEPLAAAGSYGADRIFAYLRREGQFDAQVKALEQAGHPVLVFNIAEDYELGTEFYRWEVATAITCAVLEVNAFDQPDVQDAKDRTKSKIKAYTQTRHLDEGQILWEGAGIKAFSTMPLSTSGLEDLLKSFLGSARIGDYIAINAYLPRNPETATLLAELRLILLWRTGCATTVGFGPRFLHSTGQLHKGGPGTGLFMQITADPSPDIEIPEQEMSFGTLERAQTLGDYEVLAGRSRRILRLELSSQALIQDLLVALKE
jgi:transaldolase/glucose-6-phosphate isomerase